MSLKYLVTILYRPRETMRRILDNGGSRWSAQIIILASICASVTDSDISRAGREILPGVRLWPMMAIVTVGLFVQAISWIVFVLFVAAIALPVGRFLGGKATFREVTAALAWGLVPAIWSPIYRIPFAIIASRLRVGPNANGSKAIIDAIAHGGCSLFVVYFFLQILFELACITVGSFTLAEAQQFSTQKGVANVLIAIVLPFVVVAAAVFSLRS
jgi:hypothetical protein